MEIAFLGLLNFFSDGANTGVSCVISLNDLSLFFSEYVTKTSTGGLSVPFCAAFSMRFSLVLQDSSVLRSCTSYVFYCGALKSLMGKIIIYILFT